MTTVASVCPECGSARNRIVDSRFDGGRRRRRRMCGNGHRFTTYEIAAADLAKLDQELAELREWRTQMLALVGPAA